MTVFGGPEMDTLLEKLNFRASLSYFVKERPNACLEDLKSMSYILMGQLKAIFSPPLCEIFLSILFLKTYIVSLLSLLRMRSLC